MNIHYDFRGPGALDAVMAALDQAVEDCERKFVTDALANDDCPLDPDDIDAILDHNRVEWEQERPALRAKFEKLIADVIARAPADA